MKAKLYFVLDILIFTGFLITFEPQITGESIHEWLGAAFFLTLLVHLLLHWNWVVKTLAKFFKKMPALQRINFTVDFFIFVAFIVVNLSGLMISKTVLATFGITLPRGGEWKTIHSLSADVALYLAAAHFALHWNWLVAVVKNHLIAPLRAHFSQPRRLEPVPVRSDEQNWSAKQ